MTSQNQIDANRRNALVSTGPRTEAGKLRSRVNALRHGLTAQTVIVGFEELSEYAQFETEIIAEYDPKSVIERELTLRLASLLWRLRRANLIDAGILLHELKSERNCKGREYSGPDLRRTQRLLTKGFLRMGNMVRDPLERITRYETALWRHFVQVLFSLDQAKYHRIAATRGRFTPHQPQW